MHVTDYHNKDIIANSRKLLEICMFGFVLYNHPTNLNYFKNIVEMLSTRFNILRDYLLFCF